MRNLAELNINHGGRPVMRPPPTQENIRDFEKAFGLKLPPLHLQLLMHANGGHPELNSYENSTNGNQTAINHFYHLSDDRSSARSMWKIKYDHRKYMSKTVLPFAEDGGGNLICLESGTERNPISIYLHDEDFKGVHLAESFEDFIDQLKIDPQMI
jgi:hypothetical protein